MFSLHMNTADSNSLMLKYQEAEVGHTLLQQGIQEMIGLLKIQAGHLTKCLYFVCPLLTVFLCLLQSLYTDWQQQHCYVR